MSLFLSMLPFYLFSNLHCIGMCGPLVMMLGQNRYRHLYFLGRTLSFALAGMIAGEAGAVLNVLLNKYHISAAISFFFGGVILMTGIGMLAGRQQYPAQKWLAMRLQRINQTLTLLMLRERPFATFLFGFFTIALPCGQTLIVFSTCALYGDVWVGLANGFLFALLTSPSLVLAMHAHKALKAMKPHYNTIMGICALMIGSLALCRGLADLEFIPHLALDRFQMHLVLY